MAVPTTNAFTGPLAANGVTTTFPFTFTVLSGADLTVVLRDPDGVESTVSANDYSVTLSGTAPSSGSVVFDTAPASGNDVWIYLDLDFTQETQFADGHPFIASAVNDTNDRAALRDQVLKRDIERGLLLPIGETAPTLPAASTRAEKFLFWDSNGDPSASPGTTDVPVSIDGTLAGNSDSLVPSQKAVKTYVDGNIAQDGGVRHFQGQNPGGARLFLAGVDSLTDGAGGSDWHRYFKKIMRGHLGDGGPGLHFFNLAIATQEGVSYGASGMTVIAENDGVCYPYSLAGHGLYTLAGDGSPYVDWGPASNWTTARLFYLKQSGGGTFKVGTADQALGDLTTVNTAHGSNSIGYIDVPIGGGTTGRILGIRTITGKVCLFGALFTLNSTGFLWGNLAKGGRKLADVAAQDATIRREWLTLLQPSHYLLNGGANDKSTRTGAQHAADLTAIIDDYQTASANTAITIVQHNHIFGEETTFLPDHAAQKITVAEAEGVGYIDLRKLLGSYTEATAAGLMADGTHPSDKANKMIAAYLAERLGFGGNAADPGLSPYGGVDGAVIQRTGTLTTKSFYAVAGAATTVYTLGLVAGYPSCSVKLRISCNRNGTYLNTVKDVLLSIGNATTTNQANNVTTPTVIQLVKELATPGDGLGVDFTVAASIVSDKCVIEVTPTGFAGNFVIQGVFDMTYNATVGQAVYEN